AAAGDPVLQQRLMTMVPGARVKMVDTIKFFIDGARDELMNAIRAADFVSINESEARELAGMPSIARAGRALLDGGSKAVIVKLGEYGAAYISGEDYFVAPGYPLDEVVDPTGAGDAFAGGFMGYLDSVGVIDQQAIRRAIVYGSTVASFCVEGFGPERLLTLEREEVEQRYQQFRGLTHFEVEG
ncbi:MAG: sugar kinase, partial [Chloroflexota bacterium]